MTGPIIPAGSALLVNMVRLAHGELAKSFLVHITEPSRADIVAGHMQATAGDLVDRAASPDTSLVITLNFVDQWGRGGCSWQCLTVSAPTERNEFAVAVGAVLADMVVHAAKGYAADIDRSLPGTPAPNAPSTDRPQ